MKTSIAYNAATIGLIAGFLTGIMFSVHEIMANQYIRYEMFRLIACSFQEHLNRCILLAIAIAFAMGCLFYLVGITLRWKSIPFKDVALSRNVNRFLTAPYNKAAPAFIVLSVLTLNATLLAGSHVSKGPHVVVVSIDDLRADHLGCYGYSRNTSPRIDAFAQRSVIFRRCYVPQPWTLPSHMSMLTSLYPITHGVDMTHSLNPAILTLAEVLKNGGYQTAGFVSGGPWTSPEYGFGQGFTYYSAGPPERNAEWQNRLIKQYLKKNKEKKVFLFIHYFDVHSDSGKLPYHAPAPYDNLFSADYRGAFEGGDGGVFGSEYLAKANREQIKFNAEELSYITALYDNGIAYMDKCLGDLFDMLKEMDRFDNSLIIITADHGEEFQEHGYLLHENPYYFEEIVRVPLIVKLPKGDMEAVCRGKAVDGLVESIDIMPTILDFLDMEGARMEGKSLIGMMSGRESGKEYVFGFGSTGSLFVRSERWKLLNDRGLAEGRFKLFDLHDDPGEQNNRAGSGLSIEEELKKRLQERIHLSQRLRNELVPPTGDAREKTLSLTEEEKEKLRALGYLQ